MAGATVDVAQAVGEEIAQSGAQVDIPPVCEINGRQAYDGVVVGEPMIMGRHRAALRFLKKQREAFEHISLAVFIMAMNLTQSGETSGGRFGIMKLTVS
jgi:menaquinone-dependent protoporphyrinogen IX oxidase